MLVACNTQWTEFNKEKYTIGNHSTTFTHNNRTGCPIEFYHWDLLPSRPNAHRPHRHHICPSVHHQNQWGVGHPEDTYTWVAFLALRSQIWQVNPNIEEVTESSSESESKITIVEASLSRIIDEFDGELLLYDDGMIKAFICKNCVKPKMLTKCSFDVILVDFKMVCFWYLWGGALLNNSGSPSRFYDQWPHCWTKQGRTLGTQQYFHFLRSTFFHVNL